PAHWDVSASTDLDALAERLTGSISSLLEDLDGISSIKALLDKRWLEIGADLITRSRLHYVSGNHEAALAELREASGVLSDRGGMSLGELIRRNRMTERGRLIGEDG